MFYWTMIYWRKGNPTYSTNIKQPPQNVWWFFWSFPRNLLWIFPYSGKIFPKKNMDSLYSAQPGSGCDIPSLQKLPTSHHHPATPKWLLYLPWSKAWSHEIWKTKKKYLEFLFRMLHLKIPSDLPKKSPSAPIKHLPGLTNPQVVLSGNRPAAGRCARVRGIDAKQAVSSCRKVRTALQGPNFL